VGKRVSKILLFFLFSIPKTAKTGFEGAYSLEYVMAVAILGRGKTLKTFTDSKVNRPQI
jgi:2-methylcitrate dehydratase PrpD